MSNPLHFTCKHVKTNTFTAGREAGFERKRVKRWGTIEWCTDCGSLKSGKDEWLPPGTCAFAPYVPPPSPIEMILTCPSCGRRHIDEGVFAKKPHHTHACQHCGMCWRPAIVSTVGVRFLPGFKNEGG
jgi:hypothetical protein